MSSEVFINILLALIGAALWIGVRILFNLSKTVGELNVALKVLFERLQHHEKNIERHESEIQTLKDRLL